MLDAIQRNDAVLLTALGWSMIEETDNEKSVRPVIKPKYIDQLEPREELEKKVPLLQRPALSPPDAPSKSFQTALIQLVDGIEMSRLKAFDLASTRLDLNATELQAIQEKRIANMHDTALKAQSINTWTFLQQVAATLFGAASIVTGITLISITGNIWVGGLMVGAGVLSVTSLLLTEMGVDGRIAGAITLASAAMSFLCGGLNFNVLATTHLQQLVVTIMHGAFNIANGVALFRKQYTESELTWLKAEKQDFDMALTRAHRESEEIQDGVKQASNQLAFTKEAINLLNDQHRAITTILSTIA